MSDQSQQPSPPKGKGRGRGKGKGKAAKNAGVKKNYLNRRGRQKVYDNPMVQAAHDRQRDLKAAYSSVAQQVKIALEELAERNINKAKEDAHAHEEVREYEEVTGFLDQRLQDQHQSNARLRDADLDLNAEMNRLAKEQIRTEFHAKLAAATDDFLDAQLRRVEILERLHDCRLPVDLPDEEWSYRPLSNQAADENGPYRLIRDGIEIPVVKRSGEVPTLPKVVKPTKTPTKRKADETPEGEPTPKRVATPVNEKVTRHIGGLLSAVPPPEDEDPAEDGDAEAKDKRSPGAVAEEGPSLADGMPPLPTAASDPDAYGVRLVTKRNTVKGEPHNRIMLPPVFEFEEHEIGFRDSSNSKLRGATKPKRGKFLDKPNSSYFHIDRVTNGCDATQYEAGDLDEGIVKQHELHPKYGVFLESSRNDQEPPTEVVSGKKPTVFYTPDGRMLHASRSIWPTRLDSELEAYSKKDKLSKAMALVCNEMEISKEDVEPTEEEAEQAARAKYPRMKLYKPQEDETDREEQLLLARDASRDAEKAAAANVMAELLEAANVSDEQEARAKAARSKRSSTVSRYDAIRDIFTGTQPEPEPQPVIETIAPDTSKLEFLSDLAGSLEGPEPSMVQPNSIAQDPYPVQPLQDNGPLAVEHSNLDPRLFPGYEPDMNGNGMPPQANDFLRTALNPATPSYHQPPAPVGEFQGEYQAPAPAPIPAPVHYGYPPPEPEAPRVPFSNPAHGSGSPRLPTLRTTQSRHGLQENGIPAPDMNASAQNHSRNTSIVMTNSGSFFPPAPPRSYHQGYPLQEPQLPPHMMQVQPSYTAQPGPPPQEMGQYEPHMEYQQYYQQQQQPEMQPHYQGYYPPLAQPGPPPPHVASFSIPPPSYQQIAPYPSAPGPTPSHQHSAIIPALTPVGPPPGSPGGFPAPSTPRSRGSSISAHDRRLRKLEPAPTPPHRTGGRHSSSGSVGGLGGGSNPSLGGVAGLVGPASHGGPELRTVQYDYREGIKDYEATEAPPTTGPGQIRGWSHNNSMRKPRPSFKRPPSPNPEGEDQPRQIRD